jgi:putative peptidoglycan lipid II flippase
MDVLLGIFTDFPVHLRQGASFGIMLLLPLLFLNYVNDLIINVYQAHKNYSLSNVATFLQGLCLVMSVLLWFDYGTVAIAAGFLGGALLQLLYACTLLSRHGVWSKAGCLPGSESGIFRAFAPLVLLFPLTAMIYNFTPVYFAAGLDPGTLTAINFARRIYMFIPTLFIYPLVLVLYPRLCEKAVSDRTALSDSLVDFHNLLLVPVVPMAAFFCVFAPEITGLAFSYGKYSVSALDISARSLRFFAPGAVMMVLASITGRAVFSTRNLRTAGVNLLVNIIGALAFPLLLSMLMQEFGYIGIVLGSTLFLLLFQGPVNWGFIYFFIGSFRLLPVFTGYGQNLFFTVSGLLPLLYLQFNYRYDGLFFVILSLFWLLLVQIALHVLCRTRTWQAIKFYLCTEV